MLYPIRQGCKELQSVSSNTLILQDWNVNCYQGPEQSASLAQKTLSSFELSTQQLMRRQLMKEPSRLNAFLVIRLTVSSWVHNNLKPSTLLNSVVLHTTAK